MKSCNFKVVVLSEYVYREISLFCWVLVRRWFQINVKTKFICHLNILSWLNINLHLFYFIVHIGNKNSIDTYLTLISHIKIWIKDIYELDNFEPTWKSKNIYFLPNQVFLKKNFFIICHYLISKYYKYFETT